MEQQHFPLLDAIEIVIGKRIHVAVAIRWCTKGRRGRYLQSWSSKQGRVTTIAAVREFISASTEDAP